MNQAPVLAPIGNRTINEGETLIVTPNATDANGDTLTYSIVTSIPSAYSFNSSTGTLIRTPSPF